MIIPVIMAGGSGSRLWPLSRKLHPKQFLSLFSDNSLLQDTVARTQHISQHRPIIICNDEYRFLVRQQLTAIGVSDADIILEPCARNTAPAIALAALCALKQSPDAVIMVMPSDHLIKDYDQYTDNTRLAHEHAKNGKLVTFGIEATTPETGYGYINSGDMLEPGVFSVKKFHEKPNAELAQSFVASGDFTWNSGIFIFKASVYLAELQQHRPDIFAACKTAFLQAYNDLAFIRLPPALFGACPAESIDYAVMEKTTNAVVIPVRFRWSDIGAWSSLWELGDKNDDGNVLHGDVYSWQSNRNYIFAQEKFIACVGIDDAVIVETKDALLVAHKDKTQEVKNVVDYLNKHQRIESQNHQKQYRPWGDHEILSEGDRYCVKHIMVKPGERSTEQVHYHRAEHWIVVSGCANVVRGGEQYLLNANESIFIPAGVEHYFENRGDIPLVIIEVQTGTYLLDDDILRVSTRND